MRFARSVVALALSTTMVAGCAASGVPSSKPGPTATGAISESLPPASSPAPTATTARLEPAGNVPLESAYITGIASTPKGFVLVGQEQRGGDQPPVVLAGSPDARTWDRLDESSFGSALTSIAGSALGWIATTAGTRTGVWYSTDGLTWEQVPDQAGLGISSVQASAGPSGFAMVGSEVEAGTSVSEVWTSPDGRTWSQAKALHGLGIDQVLLLPSGYVGVERNGAPAEYSSAWFSADGTSWRDLSTDPGSPFSGDSGGVMVGSMASTLVALRAGASGAVELFSGDFGSSAGGSRVTWHHEATTDAVFAGASVSTVTSSAVRAFVLGFDRTTFAPIAFTSADGLSWHRTALDPGTFGGGVPGGLVAAHDATGVSSLAAIGWDASTAGDVRPQVWRSDDGTSWTAAAGDLLGVLPTPPTGPCPTPPPSVVDDYLTMAPSLWPDCFGSRTLKIRGYIGDCGGCGGVTGQESSPSWLLDTLGYSAIYLSPALVQADTGRGGFGGMIDPAHPVTVPPVNTHVELTGHFDDPAAATCRTFPTGRGFGQVEPKAQTVAWCRQAFVVTAIRILPS